MAMTKEERKAALNALMDILNIEDEPTGEGPGGGGPQLPPEFVAAWNKIMQSYDNDKVSKADLLKLLQDIADGTLKTI